MRVRRITAIVLHDTASRTAASALSWFQRPESRVSTHVLVDRDGTVYRVVDDDKVAWHAGRSVLHGEEGVNAFSLGVELVDANDDASVDPYPEPQLAAAVEWVAEKAALYGVPLNRVVAHRDVSPGRKIDPGNDFDFATFLLRVARRMIG